MNQIKIGKFIAECRKKQGLTQVQLAEKLGITDRAVSKWENGKSMPDYSIMLELCSLLNISVNDLLNGEVVVMEDYKQNTDNLLIEMAKQKQEADKRLLKMEIVTGIICILPLLISTIIVTAVPIEEWLGTTLCLTSLIPLLIATPFMLRIEQKAGYYKCAKCSHIYVPTYNSVFIAPHINRTRYMKCPKCHKYSWNKKVLTKE